MTEPEQAMRLNRFLARAGLGSRRAVEDLVRAGRVAVDGEIATDLGRRVDPDRDQVTLDGRPVALPEDHRVYAFHKPLEVVSTLRGPGRPALPQALPPARRPARALRARGPT